MHGVRSRPRTGRLAAAAVLGAVAVAPSLLPTATTSGTPSDPSGPLPDQRPNVVLVMADDLGWSDVASGLPNQGNGHDFHDTPAIDRLASEGMVFDNAYAAVTCSPTRTALLTGMYAPRPDNNVYLVGELDRGGEGRMLVGPPQGREDGRLVLPEEAVTVAETMRDAGYATGYAGKFHVTRFPLDVVRHHGFEENAGGSRAGAIGRYHARVGRFDDTVAPSLDRFAQSYTPDYVRDEIAPYSTGTDAADLDALVGTDKHVTDALGDATIDFVERRSGQPFFAFLSHFAVHTPVGDAQPRADLLAKYRGRTPGQAPASPSYAALVEGLDQTVARVVDHLETTPDPRNPGRPLADNTIVLVTSDNGGRTDVGGWNGPLRGQKGELHEGGVRVPWLAWSGEEDLVGRGTNSSPIDATDLYPTLADFADADLPARTEPDGTSLRAAIATGERVDRPRFAHLPGYLLAKGRDQRPESTVRAGRWKLRYSYEDRRFELYDVVADLGETTDLSRRWPGRVTALGQVLLRWLDDVDAPLATLSEERKPLRFTAHGAAYADGRVRWYPRPTGITVLPGDEVPFVLERQ